ncbi:Hemicentin-2 [Papilio machaon]|uniref:Hemicentin-2 n=1 Tax=Papilio machaon TaxID=76193 RepID=A0A0N1PI85_PAPMA|nr:Hemicentin-2 [Papilio machaon]
MIWLNNGVAIDLNDLDSRFYLVGSGSLRVQSARALDAGVYTCRAHNRIDSADHSTQLQVLTAPRVSLPGGAVARAAPRGELTLRCEVRGRPAPTVSWLKDGEPLTPNNRDIALLDGCLTKHEHLHDLHRCVCVCYVRPNLLDFLLHITYALHIFIVAMGRLCSSHGR